MLLANQEKVTAENIAKAELQVQRLTKGGAKAEQPVSATAAPNGKAGRPLETTLASNGDEASDGAASEGVEVKMEDIRNGKAEEVVVEIEA